MKLLARVVAIAFLLAASLTGMPAAAGSCDHPSATGGSHHHQTPADQPCRHDQPGHPAAPCAAMPTCAGVTVAMTSPVLTIHPAVAAVAAAVSPAESLVSFRRSLDVPPPRL